MHDPIYLIDPVTKDPRSFTPSSFAALGLRERQDFEQWILAHPGLLGEELLIVTAEFDRFDRSSRRLDVLALDTEGKLVVVELKLDIGGSLADQQAIRYAAFCSTMLMEQAVGEFARYHRCAVSDAQSRIASFLGVATLPELGDRPRIILAAGSLDDPELISTVLWLRTFGLDIKCVELTPYSLPGMSEVLLVPRTLIPLPEAGDYIVTVERSAAARAQRAGGEGEFSDLWHALAGAFNPNAPLGLEARPIRRAYLQLRIGHPEVHYEWLYHKRSQAVSIALHFEATDRTLNRTRLEAIQQCRTQLEERTGRPLVIEPSWGRKWAFIGFELPCSLSPEPDTIDEANRLMRTLIEVTYPVVRSALERETAAPHESAAQ